LALEAGAPHSQGERRYRQFSARFLAIASTMGAELSEADIRMTTEIVRRRSDETKELGVTIEVNGRT
jgi:hypothetical protein